MRHTHTSIESVGMPAAAILPLARDVERTTADAVARQRLAAERAMDEVLAESFPASDPPSWNPGVARADPSLRGLDDRHASSGGPDAAVRGLDRVRPRWHRSFLQGVVSLGGGAAIAVIVPFAVLLIGLPVALALRALLELIGWLFGIAAL